MKAYGSGTRPSIEERTMTLEMFHKMFTYLDDLRNGDRRLHYLREIESELSLSRKEILSRQWHQLIRLLEEAAENVPFYKRRFAEAGVSHKSIQDPSDLCKLPVLTKGDIRSNQRDLVNPRFAQGHLIPSATGGTTDSPITIYLDRDSWARRRAATLYFSRWYGYEIGGTLALLWGAEQDLPKHQSWKTKVREWLTGPVFWLPSSYLNDEVMWKYFERLRNVHPTVLQAYPTPLYIFACFLERHGLSLPVKNINVTAEYLCEYQREKIETVFATKVFNWYGARELGHIATECTEHNGMHLNVYGHYAEVIRDETQSSHQEGQLIFTDLRNRAMPLIRYKIGDLGSTSFRECPCEARLPIIEHVAGRYVATFKKRDGTFIPGVAFTNRIIKEHQGIEQLQIVQKDYSYYQLNIVKGPEYKEQDLIRLKRRICDFVHEPLGFEVNFVDGIAAEKSGKVLFCKSEVTANERERGCSP